MAKKKIKMALYNEIYERENIPYEAPHGFIAFIYRKLKRFEVNRYQTVYDLLPSKIERLLDVGCGDGYFIGMLKNKCEECYGVDVSPLRIENAQNKFKGQVNVHFKLCDVDEGLPFPDLFFDVVTCIAVLEHVLNPPRVVKEINRVLKNGGTFIVQVPNIASFPYRINLLFGKLPVTGGFYMGADWEHLHWFTKSVLQELLSKSGFKIEAITCSGVFAKHRKLWVSMLGGDLIAKSVKIDSRCIR